MVIRSEVALLSAADEIRLAKSIEDGRYAGAWLDRDDGRFSDDDKEWLAGLAEEGSNDRARFIESNIRLVHYFARRWLGPRVTDDKIQGGCIGLIRAVDRWDWRRGPRFASYAEYVIRSSMFREHDDLVALPERMRSMRSALAHMQNDLRHNLQREPDLEDAADALEVDPKMVVWLEQHRSLSRPLSLDAPVGSGDGKSSTLAELLPQPDTADEQTSAVNAAMVSAALGSLTGRERGVVEARFGITSGRDQTLEEIAEKLGITRQGVHRLLGRAFAKLRHPSQPFVTSDWRARASCRGLPTADFFRAGKPPKIHSVCAACPVQAGCLAFAEEHHAIAGVWGGRGRFGLSDQKAEPRAA